MSTAATDHERAAVYAAEIAAFDGTDLETVLDIDDVLATIRHVVESEWWSGPAVAARSARRDARSSTARCSGGPVTTIRIARPQATIATAAHELAHALAGVAAGHDERFRRAHLDVISVITNLAAAPARRDLHVTQLEDAYGMADLAIGERTWPAPPPVDGAIAL